MRKTITAFTATSSRSTYSHIFFPVQFITFQAGFDFISGLVLPSMYFGVFAYLQAKKFRYVLDMSHEHIKREQLVLPSFVGSGWDSIEEICVENLYQSRLRQ